MADEDKAKATFHEVVEATKKCRSWKEKREKLFDFGFELGEDNDDASAEELAEEQAATPQNARQQRLVTYLGSTEPPSKTLVDDFLAEKAASDTHYPLFRRYFRAGSVSLEN